MIYKSTTADTRSCDFKNVTIETLRESTIQHTDDVRAAMQYFIGRLLEAGSRHDVHKFATLEAFHKAFAGGFEDTSWWDAHRKSERHHLNSPHGVRDNVNLIDVLEYIADCVMAGMARTGTVYDIEIDCTILQRAFTNTVEMLKRNVEVQK
jgi:hypothetical protein